jgi:hypothetical protein
MIAGFNLQEKERNWMTIPVNLLAWLNMNILQGLLIKELKPNVSDVRQITILKNGFVHGVLL